MAVKTVSILGGNWNATTAWVGGVVPITGDTVDFTATSGNLTINVSTANLIGINFTNYVNTITFNQPINTNGTVNLGTGGYTQAGTNGLVINGTATISGTTIWSRTFTISGTTITITLSNDLNIIGLTTISTFTLLSFSTGANLFNPTGDLSIASSGNVNLPNDIYINSLTINCNNNPNINLNNINVYGNFQIDGTNTANGTTKIILIGSGTWSNSSNGVLTIDLTINTNNVIELGTNVYYASGTLTYINGKIISKNNTFNISTGATTTLVNCHKINFNNIKINSGSTITMNEFFSGSPSLITNINPSSTSNYNIAFQDGFEKISKFVNISNCTLSKPQQLLVITNSPKSSTNKGIRYINQSPNGIAKGDATIRNTMTASAGGYVKDPNMK